MRTTGSPDVVVVGGGIVGAATAAFLAAGGARVELIERDGLASAASGANSGVVQHPFDPVLANLYRETLALYRELAAVSNAFPLAERPAGMLFTASSEATARREAALIDARFPELGASVIGGEALRRLEPALGDALWACRVDIGFPVPPGASTYAYATLAEARGAVVRSGRAARLATAGDGTIGVLVDDRRITAGAVVVAAGPWTPALLEPLEGRAPIAPRWGVVVELELAERPRHVLEEAGIEAAVDPGESEDSGDGAGAGEAAREPAGPDAVGFSLVPLPGVSVAGSTFLAREPDPTTWIEPILERAARFVPGVADAPIRSVHACPRPQSADGRPLVGAVPGLPNLYVCAGHGPWGISTGPACARMVADLVLGREPAIPATLHPGRFDEARM